MTYYQQLYQVTKKEGQVITITRNVDDGKVIIAKVIGEDAERIVKCAGGKEVKTGYFHFYKNEWKKLLNQAQKGRIQVQE